MFSSVIPVAGLGTRSLPASKAIPKEMLTVFDRPIIQYVVEEAVRAEAGSVILVTGRGKTSIEDHFDESPELENALKKPGKESFLEAVRSVSHLIDVQSIRQKQPRGLGHAVLMGRGLVRSDPFAVLLPDELMTGSPQAGLPHLIKKYGELSKQNPKNSCGLILLMQVSDEDVSKYGICEINPAELSHPFFRINRCLEKPRAKDTTSRLAIIGRYLLPNDIFSLLAQQQPGALGEIQLTDALNELATDGRLYGCLFEGIRFDVGDRLGFLQANLHFYLQSPDYKTEVLKYLRGILK